MSEFAAGRVVIHDWLGAYEGVVLVLPDGEAIQITFEGTHTWTTVGGRTRIWNRVNERGAWVHSSKDEDAHPESGICISVTTQKRSGSEIDSFDVRYYLEPDDGYAFTVLPTGVYRALRMHGTRDGEKSALQDIHGIELFVVTGLLQDWWLGEEANFKEQASREVLALLSGRGGILNTFATKINQLRTPVGLLAAARAFQAQQMELLASM